MGTNLQSQVLVIFNFYMPIEKYKTCIKTFLLLVGRRRRLMRKPALVLAPGNKKGMLPWRVSGCSRWGQDLSSPHVTPHKAWQQGQKCASRRCKADMGEHTEEVLKHLFCFTSWSNCKRISGRKASWVLLSGYLPSPAPRVRVTCRAPNNGHSYLDKAAS